MTQVRMKSGNLQRRFSVYDKSGRGFTADKTYLSLKEWDDEEDWDGTSLHEFLDDSEPGDTWETNNTRIIRSR
jgi:hypothetical protein